MPADNKSKLWPWLVGLNAAITHPLSPLASGLIAYEQCWQQRDADKATDEILAEVRAIHAEVAQLSDAELANGLDEVGLCGELSPDDVRTLVRLVSYRAYITRTYQYVDFVGIAQQANFVSLPLEEVFVPLSALPEEAVRAPREEERDLRQEGQFTSEYDTDSALEARLAEIDAAGLRRPSAADRPLPIAEIMGRHKHVVLLGDPGSGKTTLVKWLARACAKGPEALREAAGCEEDLVPIVVPIASYGSALESNHSLPLQNHMKVRLDEAEGAGFGELLLDLLADGRCLVLLDGLDEIPDSRYRVAASRGVADLIARYPDNRYLITSRIFGYSLCRLSGDAGHYVLQGFQDDQIKQFAHQWWRAYEAAIHPQAPDMGNAARQADELIAAIFDSAHPQVRDFARNPLLLTILALIKWQGVTLPERRVELYEVALRTLMESWVRVRSLAGPIKGVELDLGQSLRIWQRVAFWMHKERPTGAAHRAELTQQLTEALVAEQGLGDAEAEATADSFLQAAADRLGLLQERGQNLFAFLHQTFQEYLAARHIARPAHTAFDRIAPHLRDPRWREVILLTAGYLGAVLGQPEYAGGFVDSIRGAGSKYEDILHRDLLLAAACLAEQTPVDQACQRRVLEELCERVTVSGAHEAEIGDLADALVSLRHLCLAEMAVPQVVRLVSHAEPRVRWTGVLLLANARSAEAERAIQSALTDVKSGVAFCAAAALAARGQVGVGLVSHIGGLLRFLDDCPRKAAVALATSSPHVGALVGVVLACLEDQDEDGREAAARVLGVLGVKEERVVAGLMARLEDERGMVRAAAARALGMLAVQEERVVAGLVARLEDQEWYVRADAAQALGVLGVKEERAVAGLVARLEDQDWATRRTATVVLGRLGVRDERVVAGLVARLEDKGGEVRRAAAEALGVLGVKEEQVVERLVARLEGKAGSMRRAAALELGELGVKEERVVGGLVARLEDEHGNVRYAAAWALGELGVKEERVVGGLVARLEDENDDVCQAAAQALGELGAREERVVAGLVARLEDENEEVRGGTAFALGALAVKEQRVVAVLVVRLEDQEWYVRAGAAWALGELGVKDERVVTGLVGRLEDEEGYVRGAAAEALCKLAPLGPTTANRLEGLLSHGNREVRYHTARVLVAEEEAGV